MKHQKDKPGTFGIAYLQGIGGNEVERLEKLWRAGDWHCSEHNFLDSSGLRNHVNDSYTENKENKYGINKDRESSEIQFKQTD